MKSRIVFAAIATLGLLVSCAHNDPHPMDMTRPQAPQKPALIILHWPRITSRRRKRCRRKLMRKNESWRSMSITQPTMAGKRKT